MILGHRLGLPALVEQFPNWLRWKAGTPNMVVAIEISMLPAIIWYTSRLDTLGGNFSFSHLPQTLVKT